MAPLGPKDSEGPLAPLGPSDSEGQRSRRRRGPCGHILLLPLRGNERRHILRFVRGNSFQLPSGLLFLKGCKGASLPSQYITAIYAQRAPFRGASLSESAIYAQRAPFRGESQRAPFRGAIYAFLFVGFGPSPLGTERKRSGTKALWAYIAGVSRPQRGVLCIRPQRGAQYMPKGPSLSLGPSGFSPSPLGFQRKKPT